MQGDLGGDGWLEKSGWGGTIDQQLCNWFGIQCNDQGAVTAL